MTMNDTKSHEENSPNRTGLLPSEFMRKLRPELYSDSTGRTVYEIDGSTFENHLETITQRNETHEFEIFCRKLCERVICPNLRPATGPEGGGDSKADTETYAVADEITQFYIGEPKSGSERWAFAFSAKKDWSGKVRSDVNGLVGTGRNYDRIICVTSRFARARTRAELEDELTKEHGVPVEIHDRSWIVKEVIENNRQDIAFHYLRVGREVSDMKRLGPTDYSRTQQLEDIETLFDDPDTFRGMETQMVTEALLAAELSRQLEQRRAHTDGRFERAKRLSAKYGTPRQRLEVHYEAILTAFWWYDDFDLLNSSYDEFESMLLPDEHVKNVEFLTNLFQLLVICVTQGHLTIEECELTERADRLRQRLEVIALDTDQPNSALTASTSLLLLKLNGAVTARKMDQLPSIWVEFADILERARGLSEFDADGLVKLITNVAQVAGNDTGYNSLVEKTAAFVAERKSAAEGARLLVQRAKQLDSNQHFECIRLLGKATPKLGGKEYADELIDALPYLALAYRAAGLFWAARAVCLMTAALIITRYEEESELSPLMVWVVDLWAWLSLQLRHIPDLLSAIDLLGVVASISQLSEESSKRLGEKQQSIEFAFACHLLNCSDDDITTLDQLPEALDRLALFHARNALLYSLGYEQHLRDEGSIPATEAQEDVAETFSRLANQPFADQIHGPLILNSDEGQIFRTKVLGLTITVFANGTSTSVLVAESIVASIEAYMATALEYKVTPHTEAFHIEILETDDIEEPSLQIDTDQMRATIGWPTDKNPSQFQFQSAATRALAVIAGSILGVTCYSRDMEALMQQLHGDELVVDRIAMVTAIPNMYHRMFGRSFSRLSDYVRPEDEAFPLKKRPKYNGPTPRDKQRDSQQVSAPDFDLKSHQDVDVSSVIDVPLWDRAVWRGAAYMSFGPRVPPILALAFENQDAAEKIFERWLNRFGKLDLKDDIYISIIKGISSTNPLHYQILVTSRPPDDTESTTNKPTILASRLTTVMPDSSTNLDRFLNEYQQNGVYGLAPAVFNHGNVKPLNHLAILKRRFIVREYDDIGPNHIEIIAFPKNSDGKCVHLKVRPVSFCLNTLNKMLYDKPPLSRTNSPPNLGSFGAVSTIPEILHDPRGERYPLRIVPVVPSGRAIHHLKHT